MPFWGGSSAWPISALIPEYLTITFHHSHAYSCTLGCTQSPKPRWCGGWRDRVATGIEPATCRSQEERPARLPRPFGHPAPDSWQYFHATYCSMCASHDDMTRLLFVYTYSKLLGFNEPALGRTSSAHPSQRGQAAIPAWKILKTLRAMTVLM